MERYPLGSGSTEIPISGEGSTPHRRIQISFNGTGSPELQRCRYEDGDEKIVRVSVRGKGGGAHLCCGSFQWSAAVRGMTLLLLTARLGYRGVPDLVGVRGSPAASLDYALSKEPAWLAEIFGWDAQGNLNARRLFVRSNPEMKRPGPVCVSLHRRLLQERNIIIDIDGSEVSTEKEIHELREKILASHPIHGNVEVRHAPMMRRISLPPIAA